MAAITADFEAGVNAATIAAADAGSATAWNTVTIGAGATAKYDNAQKAHGSLSAKIVHGATSTASFLLWSTALGTKTDHYGRVYFYWPGGNPAATVLLIYNRLSGSGSWRIQVNTSGKFEIQNASAATIATSTMSVPAAAQWMRLEFHAVHSATVGSVTLRLYKTSIDAAIASFDEELISPSFNSLTSSNEILFGLILNIANFTLQLDDIAAGGTTWFGPASVSTTTTISAFPLGSSEAVGMPRLQRIADGQGVSTGEAWGLPKAQRIARAAAAQSSEVWGTPTVQRIVRELILASSEGWGSPTVQRLVRQLAIATGESWGVSKLQRILVGQPFASSEQMGRPLVIGGIIGNTITILAGAIASAEAWGLPTVQRLARAQGITSAEQLGIVTAQRIGRVLAVPTSEQVARPTLQRVMRAAQIQSAEQVGIPKVSRFLIAVNLATGETWGSPVVIGGVVVNFPSVAGAMLLSDRAAFEVVLIDGQTYAVGVADAAAFGLTAADRAAFGSGISDIRAGDVTISDDKGD